MQNAGAPLPHGGVPMARPVAIRTACPAIACAPVLRSSRRDP